MSCCHQHCACWCPSTVRCKAIRRHSDGKLWDWHLKSWTLLINAWTELLMFCIFICYCILGGIISFYGSIWQQISISSGNGLVPKRQHTQTIQDLVNWHFIVTRIQCVNSLSKCNHTWLNDFIKKFLILIIKCTFGKWFLKWFLPPRDPWV